MGARFAAPDVGLLITFRLGTATFSSVEDVDEDDDAESEDDEELDDGGRIIDTQENQTKRLSPKFLFCFCYFPS